MRSAPAAAPRRARHARARLRRQGHARARRGLFLEELGNPLLDPLGDAALLELNGSRLAFTTDSYVVKPLVFPGGDIGELAVNGAVNDLAVSGARPLVLSAGFIVEEGFEVARLRRLAASMARPPRRRGGDRDRRHEGRRARQGGRALRQHGRDRLVGRACARPGRVRAGDRVLVSGTLGDHGMAVMVARGELALEVELESDTAPVHELAASLLELGEAVRWLRDPTRGGLATALNELAREASLAVCLEEAALPLRREVVGACEILGIDPLYVANEGKLVAVVAPDAADDALERLRSHPLGAEAALVGEVRAEPEGLVLLDTAFGGSRIVDMLVGDPLPRIC